MTVSEVLNTAADLIDERGHYKGAYDSLDGRLCTYGAMRAACGILEPNDSAPDVEARWDDYDAAADAFGKHIGTPMVARWNDRKERTKEEVVTALRAAAEAARAET